MSIRVDGRAVEAEPGASLAAALLNGGVTHFRTSVTGEARGPVCGMGTCQECRVCVNGTPHVRACLEPVTGGAAVLTAGCDVPAAREHVVHRHTCDVAVVGAGPAGLAAATAAAESGARVLLLDESPRPGGQVWRHRGSAPAAARPWLRRIRSGADRIVYLPGTSVVDLRGATLLAQSAAGAHEVQASGVLLATGARELLLPFPGWTLTGVVGVGGAQALLKSGLDVRGLRVVLAGTGPLLLPVAAALAAAGARIVAVAEQAPWSRVARFAAGLWRSPGRLVQAARYRAAFARTRYLTGTWVVGADGAGHVRTATLTDGAALRTVECDLLCVGWSLVPATELAVLAGCALRDGFVVVDDVQQTTERGVFAAGEPTGIGGAERSVVQGSIAGMAAAGCRPPPALLRARRRHDDFSVRLAAAFALRPELRDLPAPDTIVCRCEDVTLSELNGCADARSAKLLTRAGMGPCQGRVCGAALRFLRGWHADTVRPPALPATISTMAAAAGTGTRSE